MRKIRVGLCSLWMLAECGALSAQALIRGGPPFPEVTATEDGKWVYFTSLMVLKGEERGLFQETRLYRYGPGGVTLFAERGDRAPRNEFTSNDGVVLPRVNRDGSVVTYTLQEVCPGRHRNCAATIAAAAEIRTGPAGETIDLGQGYAQVSRNGRWALVTDSDFTFDSNGDLIFTSTLVDLQSGAKVSTPPPPVCRSSCWLPCESLASDGSVLAQQDDTVGIWKSGVFTPLQDRATWMSDDGATVFVQGDELTAVDVRSGKRSVVALRPYTLMDVSSDGRYVLYGHFPEGSSGAVSIADTTSNATSDVPLLDGEGGTSGALAGGNTAVVATTTGRMLKFTASTSDVKVLFPPTPICGFDHALVPGSLARLNCNSGGTSMDMSEADWTRRIRFGELEMPILSSSTAQVTFQVPWEIQPTGEILPSWLTLHVPGDAPFRADLPVFILSFAPEFEKADPSQKSLLGLQLFNSDWSALLTAQPGPGDIVNAYMTGLGTVSGPMEDGVPAPAGVSAPITAKLSCRFYPQSSDAETLSAGLAPGVIGVYQASFRMPDDTGVAPITSVSCTVPSSGGVLVGFAVSDRH